MKYINVVINGKTETIDEFKTYKEAKEMRDEYNISDVMNYYYISTRSTKEWRNNK